MESPEDVLKQRTYNIGAMSFTPEEIADEIKKYIPNFQVEYVEDPLLQSIGRYRLQKLNCLWRFQLIRFQATNFFSLFCL